MKVFIADDETTVRQGLIKIIDWDNLGCEICGEAGNGIDCLNGILDLKPDLVLIDIRMPRMHGLDVVKQAKEQGFQGKIIIISGYSDFKYAQNAIELGVDYYLLKPIEEDELENAVIKIREELKEENIQKENKKQVLTKAKYGVLVDIIEGDTQNSKKDKYNNEFDFLKITADAYQIILLDSKQNFEEKEYKKFLEKIGCENKQIEYITIQNKNIILLIGTETINYVKKKLEVLKEDNTFLKEKLTCIIGKKVSKIEEIPISYQNAIDLSKKKFFFDNKKYIMTNEEVTDNTLQYELSEEIGQVYFETLYKSIETYNRNKIKETLLEMKANIMHSKLSQEQIRNFLVGIFIRIKYSVVHDYNKSNITFDSDTDIIDSVQKKEFLYEIMDYLEEQLYLIIKNIGNSSSDSILSDILHYIDQNYKKNLKLETIAEIFGYNSAYLGKIFTKNMGENFNSYVDKVRINYAKELLFQDKLKVYEVAECVGYKNLDYFHKKFKKYVGLSPAEYRKQKDKTK